MVDDEQVLGIVGYVSRVIDEQSVLDMSDAEQVLHKNVAKMEVNSIVELLERAVDDIEVDYNKFEEWCSKLVCYKHRVDQSLSHAYSLPT
ncbi:hypothetical protein Tco_0086005 [Tanacetum coccineum]